LPRNALGILVASGPASDLPAAIGSLPRVSPCVSLFPRSAWCRSARIGSPRKVPRHLPWHRGPPMFKPAQDKRDHERCDRLSFDGGLILSVPPEARGGPCV